MPRHLRKKGNVCFQEWSWQLMFSGSRASAQYSSLLIAVSNSLDALQISHVLLDYLIIQCFCMRDGHLFSMLDRSKMNGPFWSIRRQDCTGKDGSQLVQINSKNTGKFKKQLIFNFKCLGSSFSFHLFSFSKNLLQSNNEVKNMTLSYDIFWQSYGSSWRIEIQITLFNLDSIPYTVQFWTKKNSTFHWHHSMNLHSSLIV